MDNRIAFKDKLLKLQKKQAIELEEDFIMSKIYEQERLIQETEIINKYIKQNNIDMELWKDE